MLPPPQRLPKHLKSSSARRRRRQPSFFSLPATARRDKKWHFIFTVLSTWHFLLLAFGAFAAHRQREDTGDGGLERDWKNVSRLAMLGAHALRPIMLISNLETTRRVFTNVLRRDC